jgi:hypothetical protein
MRWMSNLFRLAYLELADEKSIADGREPSHHAEIRRLRRMSMAPGVGRHYPVGENEAAEDFLLPEEARELVEIWRSRRKAQALEDDPDFDIVFSQISPRALGPSPRGFHEDNTEDDDEAEYEDEEYEADEDDEAWNEDDSGEEDSAADDQVPGGFTSLAPSCSDRTPTTPWPRNSDDEEWPDAAYPHNRHRGGQWQALPPVAPLPALSALRSIKGSPSSHHRLTKNRKEPAQFPTRAMQIVRFAAIMLLAVLLGRAAGRFIDAYLHPPRSQPADEHILAPTKIVPSAVPRQNSESAAADRSPKFGSGPFRRLDSWSEPSPDPPD